MALNMKKIDRKRTKADEMLKQVELNNSEDQKQSNSTQSTIESLYSAEAFTEQAPPAPIISSQPSEFDVKGKPDQGLGLNQDGTYKQSRAGRKKKSSKEKKAQIVLTLNPEIISQLESWAKNKPRSATNYLSMFVEDHLEEILELIDKK